MALVTLSLNAIVQHFFCSCIRTEVWRFIWQGYDWDMFKRMFCFHRFPFGRFLFVSSCSLTETIHSACVIALFEVSKELTWMPSERQTRLNGIISLLSAVNNAITSSALCQFLRKTYQRIGCDEVFLESQVFASLSSRTSTRRSDTVYHSLMRHWGGNWCNKT